MKKIIFNVLRKRIIYSKHFNKSKILFIMVLLSAFTYGQESKQIDKSNISFYGDLLFSNPSGEYVKSIKDDFKFNNSSYKLSSAGLELGLMYKYVGDFHKAINQYEKTKPHITNVLDALNVHLKIVEVYDEMDRDLYSEKITKYLKIADSIKKKENYSLNENYTLRLFFLKANNYYALKEYIKARAHYQELLDILGTDFHEQKVFILNNLGVLSMELSDLGKAEAYFQKAISISDNYSTPYENLGEVYLAQKKFAKSLEFCQKAISIVLDKNYKLKLTNEDLELVKEKHELLNHLLTKSKVLIAYYKHNNNTNYLEQALSVFKTADKLVDIIRFRSNENLSKLYWREKSALLYANAVEVSYLLNKVEDAYYFMERNKAILLLENISNQQAKSLAKLPDSISEREFELKQNVLLAENALYNAKGEEKKNFFRDSVYQSKSKYENFIAYLETNYSSYVDFKKNIKVLPYKDFKKKYAKKNNAVLHYIINDKRGYGLLTYNDGFEFFKIDDVGRLNSQIIKMIQLFKEKANASIVNKLSYQVFSQLIPNKIYSKLKTKNLTIIPDYTLQQFPFEALVINSDGTYFIEDNDIHYAYSMSYLDVKKDFSNKSKKDWLGMAPVSFHSTGLHKLPFSEGEVSKIKELIPKGTVFLKDQASKANWLEHFSQYKVHHLSTHADIDSTGNHWIAFADDKLYLKEIYATKNISDMLVLSACNTSVGELQKGEGVMSLTRGFFHSGVKSVVASLWEVNDISGKEILIDFYKELNKGITKSAALRNAKLNYLKDQKEVDISPFYWSTFIVIGDNSPINSTYTIFWILPIIGILILIIFIAILLTKKTVNLSF